MIAKMARGGDHAETASRYDITKGKVLECSFLSGIDPDGIAAEIDALASDRKRKQKMLHVSLAAHPDDPELTDQQWAEIGAYYIERMEFSDCPYMTTRHFDEPQQHVHLLTSWCRPDGTVVSDSHFKYRQQVVMREIEAKYRLHTVPNSWETDNRALTHGENKKQERTGKTPPRRIILRAVEGVLASGKPTFAEFVSHLETLGVQVLPAGKADVSGLSFSYQGVAFKASQVARNLSWNKLQQQIDFDLLRDRELIERLRERASAEPDCWISCVDSDGKSRVQKGKKTLDFMNKSGDQYYWGKRLAIDASDPNRISIRNRGDSTIRAALQIAQQRGWRSIALTGSGDFKKKAWLQAQLMGFSISGYTPTKSDEALLRAAIMKLQQPNHPRVRSIRLDIQNHQ